MQNYSIKVETLYNYNDPTNCSLPRIQHTVYLNIKIYVYFYVGGKHHYYI